VHNFEPSLPLSPRIPLDRLLLLLAWVAAVFPRPTLAQPLRLALADALVRAEQRAPEVVLARHAVRESDARHAGAGILLPVNPRLTAEARPAGALSDLGYAANLDVQLDLGGAPAARVREVDRDVELALSRGELDRRSARLRAADAYLRTQLAALRAQSARDGIELARRVLDAAQQRIEAGAGSEFERASAQLELSRIEAEEQAALREREASLMALRDALDLPAQQALELSTAIEQPPELAPLATYQAKAGKEHPELRASQARQRSLAATQARLERETFPRLGFYAGVDAAPRSPVFGLLGISGELPVAQRNQGPRAVVASARESEAARRELLGRGIRRAIAAAWSAHARRSSELRILSESALPAAERSFALAEAGWKAGRFDWFRVALAARDLVDLRSQRIAALAALWGQRVVLAHAVGGEFP
jgi:outer membrane protein, heavy metal efflux system